MNKFSHSDYPKTNPLFIATDKTSFNFIRRLNGICLLANKFMNYEELSFCYQREIWVIYSHTEYFSFAMELAHILQSKGANKILVFLLSSLHFDPITK